MEKHSKIIREILSQAKINVENGYGPFLAALYDETGNLISQSSNSVIKDCCSNHHAEMNAIKLAEKKLGTYDLSKYNLSLYVTAEPCMMCLGAILWSGIKKVFYSVSTKDVEEITGFDEGIKPDWIKEFENRGIEVCGEIEVEEGKKLLTDYVKEKREIYKPKREK
ncbi:nucleoside deaminase [bacterium]|nr:nucleoside deaminase [bacterium]